MDQRVYTWALKNGSLKDLRPDLLDEWDYLKNSITPENVSSKSNTKFYWLCKNYKHSWKDTPNNRGSCPYCANRALLMGFNDLKTLYPDFYLEYSSFNPIDRDYFIGFSKRVVWICKRNHYWESSIADRINRSSSCRYCQSKILLSGTNDLETMRPAIAQEFDRDKNDFSPKEIIYSSATKAYWLCIFGHSWQSPIKNRTKKMDGCPYCTNQKIIQGYNDLATTHPHLIAYWSSKNNISFHSVSFGSNQTIIWECRAKHEFAAAISSISYNGFNCTLCSGKKSKLENTFLRFLETIYSGKIIYNKYPIRDANGKRLQLDFYLPDLNIAFEVQDNATHTENADIEYGHFGKKKGPEYHELKRRLTSDMLGAELYDIWEDEIRDLSYSYKIKRIIDSKI